MEFIGESPYTLFNKDKKKWRKNILESWNPSFLSGFERKLERMNLEGNWGLRELEGLGRIKS